MSHPFEKMFLKALKKTTMEENLITQTALELLKKGYRLNEITGVLLKLEKSLIDDTESRHVQEAREFLETEFI